MTPNELAKSALCLSGGGIVFLLFLIGLGGPFWCLWIVAGMEVLALLIGLIHESRKIPKHERKFYVGLGTAVGILVGPLVELALPGLGMGILVLYIPGGLLGAILGWCYARVIGAQ